MLCNKDNSESEKLGLSSTGLVTVLWKMNWVVEMRKVFGKAGKSTREREGGGLASL